MQDKITKVLKAIADPTRREIFHAVVVTATALSISQISGQFQISRQGVTKHIKTLEGAGLIQITSQGRERYCHANPKPLEEVQKWLQFYDKFWDDSLDRLGSYLDAKKEA
ncbi:metalloregulator ArsR/SmtB family transcription factor [Aureisphaera galaxeae]|uniref:ArsR/SmtB family transcription factor n=1 Tax=Aureisphaera galaxeae TaxID=1538023 RepID=UPI002350AE75|nr:metalloregulator ArsR/SmtB family transcription factor [Aureisphaera galaxeae]MDC8004355.1 metalloregulator ArsR/SmtB family transcription factor [Aureisphaera galaxeae]